MIKDKEKTKRNDVIKLSNGKTACIIVDPNKYNNIYVVQLANNERRVVDKSTLELIKQI